MSGELLDLHTTIGASVLADSMSARATESPLTMPDI